MQRTLTGLVASWILVVGCGVAAAQTSETIRLTNGEWQPYLSKDTPHYGFASHIVTEAFELVGVEVEYGFFPWKRSYKIAKEGTWDGTAVWVDSDERREDFFFSDAVVPSTWGFFHLKDSGFDWDSYEDLTDVKIGTGWIHAIPSNDDVTNLKELVRKRIDAVVIDKLVL